MTTEIKEQEVQQEQTKAEVKPEYHFTVSASTLYEVFSYLSTTVDETVITINNDGWSIKTMNPSHVSLIDIRLEKDQFHAYGESKYPEVNEEFKITLNTDETLKALKMFKATRKYDSDPVDITIDEPLHKFVISKQDNSLSQLLHTIDTSYNSSCPLPKIDFNAEFIIPSDSFLNALQSVEKASDYVTITLAEPEYFNEEGLTFTMEGKGDSATVVNTLRVFDPVLKEEREPKISQEKNQSAIYSLDYLLKIIKIMKTTGFDLKVQFSTKMPLLITFANTGHFYLAYYLAPRVQD